MSNVAMYCQTRTMNMKDCESESYSCAIITLIKAFEIIYFENKTIVI